MVKKETKKENLNALSVEELEAKLLNAKKEQFNLRVQHSTGNLANTAGIRKNRREVAKINTILADRKKN